MTKLPVATESPPAWAAGLSLRERRFVEEFIVDLNGRAAGVPAGLGKNPKKHGRNTKSQLPPASCHRRVGYRA
jgi:hypothetical protein